MRQLALAGMLGVSIAVVNTMTSCELTETVLCASGRRCPPGTQCVSDQDLCVSIKCGNGVIELGEVCDDGNVASADGCSADCMSDETCDNGIVDVTVGERCDDGNDISGDGCSGCQLDCGNKIVDAAAGEECDDGDNSNTDACLNTCRAAYCGDDYVWLGVEDCDGGGEILTCDSDCTFVECGDGYRNLTAGETCDDGNSQNGDGCNSSCQIE